MAPHLWGEGGEEDTDAMYADPQEAFAVVVFQAQ